MGGVCAGRELRNDHAGSLKGDFGGADVGLEETTAELLAVWTDEFRE
jgi:hypothetical protein